MSPVQGVGEPGIGGSLGLHSLDTPRPLQPPDPRGGQRAGEPVEGGKRGAVIEVGRDPDDDRKTEMTAGDDLGVGAKRTSDLDFDDLTVIVVDH